jgi:hypothetical protein
MVIPKILHPHDLIYVPSERGSCLACGGALFAVACTYIAETGEPVEGSVELGCIDCEVEISGLLAQSLRHWVRSSYRAKV